MPLRSIEGTYGISLALLFIVYFATAIFGLSLHAINTFASLIWPPTGIALAALFLYGYRLWPAVLLGAFFANFYSGAPLLVAAGIGIGNALEALGGAYLLKRYVGENFSFGRLSESLIFIIGPAFLATSVSATIGVASLFMGGIISLSQLELTWLTWWLGDTLGALIVAPFLLRWLSEPFRERTPAQVFEIVALSFAIFGVALFVFWTPYVALPYSVLVPLVWAALRTGPRGVTLGTMVVAIVATAGTLAGLGPIASGSVEQDLFTLQLFMGTVAGIFLVFVSVVEDRRRTADELEEHVGHLELALEKIRAEDATKDEFLATLAHELRNPLSPILSSIELLKLRATRKEDSIRHAKIVEKHARSMSALLDDLLDVSRISAQQLRLQKKPVYLCSPIAAAVEAMEPEMRSRGHNLEVSIIPHPILMDADPLRIEQIIVNLLSNAAKYTPSPGKITLRCERRENAAIISVRDSGVGIAASMLDRIFEPFLQVRRSDSPREGVGIGLTLTKKLVELHGGTIEARSEGEGKGAEFIVRLPVPAPNAFVRETPKEARERKRPLIPLKVLVVDDNLDAANALGKLLSIRGHDVILAADGEGALRIAPTFRPDAIVLDIGLPDMDGYTVARALKRSNSTSALIALTGYGQESDKAKAKAAGFHYHLTKPVGIAKLEEALAKVVPAREKTDYPVMPAFSPSQKLATVPE